MAGGVSHFFLDNLFEVGFWNACLIGLHLFEGNMVAVYSPLCDSGAYKLSHLTAAPHSKQAYHLLVVQPLSAIAAIIFVTVWNGGFSPERCQRMGRNVGR